MSGAGGAGITSGYILDRVTVRPGRLGEGPLVVVARIDAVRVAPQYHDRPEPGAWKQEYRTGRLPDRRPCGERARGTGRHEAERGNRCT